MANELEKSIFFPGGRILLASTLDETQGLKFTRKEDGDNVSWTITLNAEISDTEAKDIVRCYANFIAPAEDEPFEKKYPNQVFMEAFTDKFATESINIPMNEIELTVLRSHKSQEDGQVILRMTPAKGIGKTQNGGGKTQNVASRIPEHEGDAPVAPQPPQE